VTAGEYEYTVGGEIGCGLLIWKYLLGGKLKAACICEEKIPFQPFISK
jgi:hypothetical protein